MRQQCLLIPKSLNFTTSFINNWDFFNEKKEETKAYISVVFFEAKAGGFNILFLFLFVGFVFH